MDLELTGKQALVTGGSRGIGKAVARALAAEGCDVAVVARGREMLEASAAEIASATGRRVVAIVADTGSRESIQAMVASAGEALGGVNILVNCAARPAGQAPAPKLDAVTDELFWEDMNVKVLGYLRCAQTVAPLMVANGWGRIINISGLAARMATSAVGSMRNVAVAALTKNLADELGPRGVNVTVVHPGLTRTEATPGVVSRLCAARGISEEEAERSLAANSIRHLVDADEVASVVAFLASPRSRAINGDAVICGGGQPGPIFY
ncbi:MAG: SDR family oxidoreductase [Acidimicrobiaceae bacterium]|nr:SDR family oxidoreductase [Acidimicrobiaceae bacterium]